MPNATGGSTFGSNCPSIRISTNSTELVILTHSAAVYVSVDGAAPTKYTQTAGIAVVITGLSGTHTYNIWCSDVFRLYVGILSGSFSNVTDKKRLDQFGDSITQGGSGGFSTQGDVETFAAASALGYVGGTYGVGGNTIAALNTRLDTVLAAKTVTGSDVAIIAVGRNDGATASGTRQSGYVSIINKLIAKGYGKILCRSVLRDGDGDSYPLINADIAAAVTTVADAKAVYVDIEGWSPVATHDDVHPIEAGYITMRGYAIADYPAYLP